MLRSAASSRPPGTFHQDGNALQLDNAECDVQPDRASISQDRVALLSDGLQVGKHALDAPPNFLGGRQ